MRTLAPVLLVVGLLVGGGARLFTSMPDPTLEPVSPKTSVSGNEDPEPETPVITESGSGSVGPAAGGSAAGGSAAGGDDRLSRLRSLIASVPTTAASGTGSITGIVVDDDEAPVPGLELRLVAQGRPPGVRSTTENIQEGDLERYVLDRVAEHRHRHGMAQVVTSDEEGRIRFENLAALPYGIEAVDDGMSLSVEIDDRPRRSLFDGDDVHVTVRRPCRVSFEVRLPDGSLADRAQVSVGASTLDWTPENSTLDLYSGSHWVKATAPGYVDASRQLEVAGDRTRPVILELGQGGGIELTVIPPPGEQKTRVLVRHAAVVPGDEINGEWLVRHSSSTNFPMKNVDGESQLGESLKLHPLPPGEYAVGIGRTTDSVDVIVYATVSEGYTSLSVELPPVDPLDVIEVEVLSAEGLPVPATFRLQHVDGWNENAINIATVEKDGRYWIRPEPVAFEILEGTRSGILKLSVKAQEHGSRMIEVDTTSLSVQFSPRATLLLQVTGYAEDESGTVSIFDVDGMEVASAQFEELGEPIGPLEAGDVEVEVTVDSATGSEVLLESMWVALAEGENQASIAIPPRFSLEVHFPGGIEGRELMLVRADGPVGRNRGMEEIDGESEGETRRYTGLFPGRYSLMAAEESMMRFEAMEIDLRGDRKITFDGKPVLAFMVRMRGGADAEGTDFLDGDIVIGGNGKEFETFAELMQTMMLLESGVEASFLVERGNSRLDIEVTARTFELLMGQGARIVPLSRE